MNDILILSYYICQDNQKRIQGLWDLEVVKDEGVKVLT